MCVFCAPFASRMQLRGIPVSLPGPVRHAVLQTPSLSSRLPRPFRYGFPNSHGITSFADHHPLTPLESYRFKNEDPAGMRVPSDNREPRDLSSSPKSLRHNVFADPHPLTPVRSIFYKSVVGRRAQVFFNLQLLTLNLLPVPLSPLPATLRLC